MEASIDDKDITCNAGSSVNTNNDLHGAESVLVGISPHYWAYVPMNVADIHNLQLVDGVNCSLVQSTMPSCSVQLIPISNCRMVGYIVNVDVKSNGSTFYTLDDGTGLIDCISWSNQDDKYFLSSIMEIHENNESRFKIGDLVRIFGKVQCVMISSTEETARVGSRSMGLRAAIRQIQISIIQRIESSTSEAALLDSEANHWIDYVNTTSTFSTRSDGEKQSSGLQDATNFLEILGPTTSAQVNERLNLCPADDDLASWRVFGASCCCSLTYMEPLLYCHCQAKKESLDPCLTFRDAVLELLLKIEDAQNKALRFQYKTIVEHDKLQDVAMKEVSCNGNDIFKVKCLFQNTFRALRHDGILYLEDAEADMYLFISRKQILEPYVRAQMEAVGHAAGMFSPKKKTDYISFDGAPYLSKVHIERILYIRRSLTKDVMI